MVNEATEIIQETSAEKTVEEVELYAYNFMANSQPEHSFRVLKTYPLYGLDDTLTGYYVTFLRDGKPDDYVLLSFLHTGSPIVTFSFEGHGFFTDMEIPDLYVENKFIKYIGPDEFYIESKEGNEIYYFSIYDSETMISEKTALAVYQETLLNFLTEAEAQVSTINNTDPDHPIFLGVIDWNDAIIDYNSNYSLPKLRYGECPYWTTDDFGGENDCGPTALTNILCYWGWNYNQTYNYVKQGITLAGNYTLDAKRVYWKLSDGLGTNGIVNSGSPEAKDFNFEFVDTYMIGNVKFIWTEFKCPHCGKQISIEEMKIIERKAKEKS